MAVVQLATDYCMISPSSIGSNHTMQWASWACPTMLPLICMDSMLEEWPLGSHHCASATSHPMSLSTKFSNWCCAKPLVSTSDNCSVVSTFCTFTSSLKWLWMKWYFTTICLVQNVTLVAASANRIIPVFSSQTLLKFTGSLQNDRIPCHPLPALAICAQWACVCWNLTCDVCPTTSKQARKLVSNSKHFWSHMATSHAPSHPVCGFMTPDSSGLPYRLLMTFPSSTPSNKANACQPSHVSTLSALLSSDLRLWEATWSCGILCRRGRGAKAAFYHWLGWYDPLLLSFTDSCIFQMEKECNITPAGGVHKKG